MKAYRATLCLSVTKTADHLRDAATINLYRNGSTEWQNNTQITSRTDYWQISVFNVQ